MKGKKLLTALLMAAISFTAVGGTVMSACGKNDDETNTEQPNPNPDPNPNPNPNPEPDPDPNPNPEPDYPEVMVGEVTMSRANLALASNESQLLRVTRTGDYSGLTVVWSSNRPDIATVTQGGRVTSVSPGVAIITAAVGPEGRVKTTTCVVTVFDGAVNSTEEEQPEVSEKVQGRTYWVSPEGTATAAGTESDPMSIQKVLDFDHSRDDPPYEGDPHFLLPGDTIMVKPGTYNVPTRIQLGYSGDYHNPITIKNADPTQKAVISFYDMQFDDNARGVQINGNYFIWDSIDICGAGDNGMYIGGSYNKILNSEFYDNRDTGLQLGRAYGTQSSVHEWPSYNLIKNCTSYNNYDNETYGENADGFAAKLTVGYGNIFDGCIAYRNSDDGWDLFAKTDSGNIGAVMIYNCVAFENGYIAETQASFNAKFPRFNKDKEETNTVSFKTRDGDGNGFKLGGSIMEGEVFLYNCLTFNNRMHGVTDNSNPGVLVIDRVTSYNNAAGVDNEYYLVTEKATGDRIVGATVVDDGEGNLTVMQVKTVDNVEQEVNVTAEVDVIVNPGYGSISYNENADECANVDIARQTYSYNHLANTLSIINGNKYCGSDAYRGTVKNSFLTTKSGTVYYVIEGVEEYDTNKGNRGVRYTGEVDATEIFKALPAATLGTKGEGGSDNFYGYIHKAWRNEDGSINVGDVLTQKDAESTYGCTLNLDSYEAYTHWAYAGGVGDYENRQIGTAQAIRDMLYLPIQPEACYQDFEVVARMMDYPISWESSNPEVLKVHSKVERSISGSMSNHIEIFRPLDEDVTVTLTATVNVGYVTSVTKDFTIVVKRNTYKIGEMEVEGLVDNDIIVDQYTEYSLPDPVIHNATSEVGAVIDPSLYNLTYKYWLDGKKKNSFSAFSAGVWTIDVTATLKSGVNLKTEGDDTATYEYTVHVAATDVMIDFATVVEDNNEVYTGGFFVNKNGFTIYGQPTNPSGTIYVLKVDDVSAATPDNATVKAQGQAVEFKTTNLNLTFPAENNAAYNIYYVFESVDGSQLSEVKEFNVTTQDITTKADFEAMLASNKASVIYRLANDIDCGGSLTTSDTKFVGLFNGMGHTISNVSINNPDNKIDGKDAKGYAAIFRTVENGTIMNVKFDNITLTDAGQSTGIIGQMYGGYAYNIKITNIKISGAQRIGALVGTVTAYSGKGASTYIDKIEVTNAPTYKVITLTAETFGYRKYFTKDGDVYTAAAKFEAGTTYYDRIIDIKGDRSSGIVGFIQAGSATGWCIVSVTNCYTNVSLESGDYCAGIVGRLDNRNDRDVLTISNCYFTGLIKATKRAAGIIGGFGGSGKVTITGCVNLGVVYYGNNLDIVLTPQKNSSGIVGNYSTAAAVVVDACYATYGEHNSNYNAGTINSTSLSTNNYALYWEDKMAYDMADVWEYVKEEGAKKLDAPYVRLRNVGGV